MVGLSVPPKCPYYRGLTEQMLQCLFMFTIIITARISSSVSLNIELILIVICDGENSAVIQWLDWSVVVAHERRISTMFTFKFPELVKLKYQQYIK